VRAEEDPGRLRLADELYEDAEKIVLVVGNLNTYKLSSLYQAFEPAEARRLWQRFEAHHTPKHGSWLNMAEIELSVLPRQCLAGVSATGRAWRERWRRGSWTAMSKACGRGIGHRRRGQWRTRGARVVRQG
jgi:hypothetical protein